MGITGRITGWFLVGASVDGMFVPWLIGQLFTSIGPWVTIVVISVDMVAALGVYAILMRYSTRHPAQDPISLPT